MSLSAGKDTGVALVPLKCIPTDISGGINIAEVPGCHFLWQMSFQWGSQNFFQGLVSHELTAYLFLF